MNRNTDFFVFPNTSSPVRSQSFKKAESSYKARAPSVPHLALYSLSPNFLSSTSYLSPAYQDEVRDVCLHGLSLSARVIHGNGKVQARAVGGRGFLLFFLQDSFFLKSLTLPKLKKVTELDEEVEAIASVHYNSNVFVHKGTHT